RGDLERSPRGSGPRHEGRGIACAARRRRVVTAAANRRGGAYNLYAKAAGLGSLVIFLLVAEAVIRAGLVSRYIVPPPSEIAGSFYRIITEEHVPRRFLITATECLAASAMITVFGIAGGVLMH